MRIQMHGFFEKRNVIVANAGVDKEAQEGSSFNLDGTGSTGLIATFEWRDLSNGGVLIGTGSAPNVSGLSDGVHNIELTASDGVISDTDTVQISLVPFLETSATSQTPGDDIKITMYGGDYEVSTDGGVFWIPVTDGVQFTAQTAFIARELNRDTVTRIRFWGTPNSSFYGTIDMINTLNLTSCVSMCRDTQGLSSFTSDSLENVTDFRWTWENNSNLLSFPLIDVSSGIDFFKCWYQNNNLVTFPITEFTSATDLNSTWGRCHTIKLGNLNFPVGKVFISTFQDIVSGVATATISGLNTPVGDDFRSTFKSSTGLLCIGSIDTSFQVGSLKDDMFLGATNLADPNLSFQTQIASSAGLNWVSLGTCP